jgi:exopolysaccharide biosynthesis polyprenyl glycosylphosphotransferase
MQNIFPLNTAPAGQGETFPQVFPDSVYGVQRVVAKRHNRKSWESILSLTAVTGDGLMIVLGFVLAFWLRYYSGLIFKIDYHLPLANISDYWQLIFFGSAVVFVGLLGKGFYCYKYFLSPQIILGRFLTVLSVCLFAFIGVTLAFRTVPAISRAYVIFAWFTIFFTFYSWRLVLSWVMHWPVFACRLRKRLVVVGAGPETARIHKELGDRAEMEFIGWIQTNKPNRTPDMEEFRLGSVHELGHILQHHAIDVAVLADAESLQREGISYIAKVCENEHVQFKVVPHFFEILISGLRPSVIGGVPVLGVDSLPLDGYENQAMKRVLDIFGAAIGLVISIPLMIIFGGLVYLESRGPIYYKQVRSGQNGRNFWMYKIRSMRMNAEGDGKARWAMADDPRRLRVGTFMRRWNIDEIPQFWNVLKGDMSLVGPRPERPELIEHFKSKIPHYQARHSCRPGMTGWAQVNGLRGNTSLEERIRYDIWYLENWSVWLDFRIKVMTLFRQSNAY